MAYRIPIDPSAEKSATNPTSFKEKVEKHPFYYIAVTAIAVATTVGCGVFWLSEKYRVEPKNERAAYLEQQISKLRDAYDPDRKQINELSATIQKLENSQAVLQDSLKKSYNDNAALQKRIKNYETNSNILSAIRELNKEKSLVDRNLYPLTTNQAEGPFAKEQTRLHEMQMYKSSHLQDRILSLQQKLGCEPK